MKWLAASLIAPFLLWIALSPSAAFEGDTLKLGGDGGSDFHDRCNAGEAIVGLYYTAGKDLDEVAAVCQAIQGATVFGARRTLPAHGGLSLDVQGTIACPEPMVVQKIYASESAIEVVHDFWLLCRNLVTGEQQKTAWSLTNGGRGGKTGHTDCGDDSYAAGIWGGFGSLVDAIGLTCTTYHQAVVNAAPPPPPNTPPPPPPPPKPNKPPLKIDNGDQNADSGNAGGGGASAAADTTIYDQPGGNDVAYLAAGDPVTIVSCNGDNWCRISKPSKGWVWGDDLSR